MAEQNSNQSTSKSKEVPGYVKTGDLADLFGVSPRWIQILTKDGIIKKYKLAAGVRYNVVESTKLYITHLQSKLEEKLTSSNVNLESKKLEAEADLKTTKASLEKLKFEELEATMHRAEDVEALTTDLLMMIEEKLEELPNQLAPKVRNVKNAAEASQIISEEVYGILRDLANYQFDPIEYENKLRSRSEA